MSMAMLRSWMAESLEKWEKIAAVVAVPWVTSRATALRSHGKLS